MIAHIDLYQEVEYIVEMNLQELKNKSTNELAEFKTQLKNVFRRIKTDRERFDKTRGFYKHSGYKMDDLQEKIDEIKKIIKDKKKQVKKIDDQKSSLAHPFTDDETFELFKYIEEKWNYNYGQKWADIWNELDLSDKYKAPFKNDYQTFIITTHKYTGKFQYDKVKTENNENRNQLIEIIGEFSKK